MHKKGLRDLPDPVVTDDVKKAFRKCKKKKTKYYIMTASKKNLQGEQMLVVDVYERKEADVSPAFRVFCGKDDYTTLDIREKPKWRDGALCSVAEYGWVCYGSAEYRFHELKYATNTDRDTAVEWFDRYDKRNGCDNTRFVQTDTLRIDKYQDNIRLRKNQIRWQAERDRMDLMMSMFGKLPKDWKTFSQEKVMDEHNYIFYQLGKNKGLAYCSRCKHDFKIKKEDDGQWSTWGIDVPVWSKGKPKHNKDFYCPHCNRFIPAKSIGYGHNLVEVDWSCLVQNYGPNVLVRFHRHIRDYRQDYRHPSECCTELYRFVQTAQGVIDAQYDIDKHFNREDWVSIPNKPWWYNPSVFVEPDHVTLYNEHLDEDLKDTWLRYCSIEKYLKLNPVQTNPYFVNKYIGIYRKHPYIEKLVKIGFGKLAEEVMSVGPLHTQDGNNICEVLKISRENFLFLKRISENPTPDVLMVLQKIQDAGQRVTLDEFWELMMMRNIYHVDVEDLLDLRQYTTIHKIDKYAKKQKDDIGFDMQAYMDYIRWIKEMGADLRNEFNLFPKDFWEAHDRKSNEYVAFKDARLRELMKEFNKQLEKQKATKAESMAVAGLLIRLPRKIEELDREGEVLHHCVGTYKQRVINGETRIFFIRQEADPEKPYYTLEWKDDHVVQCRGRNNCNMTPEVKAFVKIFEEKMGAKKKRRRAS